MAIYLPPEDAEVRLKKPEKAEIVYSTSVQKDIEQSGKDEVNANSN